MQSERSILTVLLLIGTDTVELLDFVVGRDSSAELPMLSASIQVLQGHLIAELVLIQEVHHVWLVVPQCLDGVEDIHSSLVSQHLTDNADGTECTAAASSVQAVHDCTPFAAIVFLLPLVYLLDELQEGALGHRCVPIHRPAQELELLNHPMSILGPGGIVNPENPADDVFF